MPTFQYNRELELLYSPSRWNRRLTAEGVIDDHMKTVTEASERAQKRVPCQLDVPYGDSPAERLDIFGAEHLPEDAPIMVFVHGGYWQDLSRSISSYCAEPLFKGGCVVIIVGYDLAPKATLDTIVAQTERATRWIVEFAKKRHSTGVHLIGHCAGVQLIAMLSSSRWLNEKPEDADYIKSMIMLGGVFLLPELIDTYVNDLMKLNDEEARRNSPQLLVDQISPYLSHNSLFFLAEYESAEFVKQSQNYCAALKQNGMKATCTTVPGIDHFQLAEKLEEPEFSVTQALLEVAKKRS